MELKSLGRGVGRIVKRVWKRVKKRGGGTTRRYVGIDSRGRWKFLKTPTRGTSTRRSGGGSSSRSVRKTGRRRKITIPLAPLIGLAVGLEEPFWKFVERDYRGAIDDLSYRYTGWNRNAKIWQPEGLAEGLLPLIIGAAVHKFVGGDPLNVNRILARAGLPLIRI